MKQLLHWATLLYPRSWRIRYGEEFAALLEDAESSPKDLLDVTVGALTMRIATLKIPLLSALTGLSIGLGVWFFSAPVYRAAIQAQAPERDLFRKSTESVLQRNSLAYFITSYDLYKAERSNTALEDVAAMMKRDILLRPAGNGAVEVAFLYPDAKLAESVVADLAIELRLKTQVAKPTKSHQSAGLIWIPGSAICGFVLGWIWLRKGFRKRLS